MIAHLRGILVSTAEHAVILDVAGVGYRVHVGQETLATLGKKQGEEVAVFTHLAPRENALDLYGFLDTETLAFFELLIGISGIGPKSALAILNVADVATLTQAIQAGESTYLTKVSGIGKKNAEKIILELKDKLGPAENADAGSGTRDELDALEALQSLGYSTQQAREALKKVPKDIIGTNERLKEALKLLGSS